MVSGEPPPRGGECPFDRNRWLSGIHEVDAELIARETPGVKNVVNTIVGHVP